MSTPPRIDTARIRVTDILAPRATPERRIRVEALSCSGVEVVTLEGTRAKNRRRISWGSLVERYFVPVDLTAAPTTPTTTAAPAPAVTAAVGSPYSAFTMSEAMTHVEHVRNLRQIADAARRSDAATAAGAAGVALVAANAELALLRYALLATLAESPNSEGIARLALTLCPPDPPATETR